VAADKEELLETMTHDAEKIINSSEEYVPSLLCNSGI
jgi:hypothetical protein